MSNDSQESPSSRHRFPSVLTQMQIERLKREDDDEHWISGEELYTEGSSDDDDDQRLIIKDVDNVRSIDSIAGISASGVQIRSKSLNPVVQKLSANSQIKIVNQKLKIDEPTDSSEFKDKEISSSSYSVENYTEKINDDVESAGSDSKSQEENLIAILNDDVDEGKEISWRPKREDNYEVKNLIFEDSIVKLRESQFEYLEILESLSDLKTSLNDESLELTSANSKNRCNNKYCENENDVDSLAAEISDEISAAAAAVRKEIEVEDVSVSYSCSEQEYVDLWSNAINNTGKIKKEMFKVLKLDMCIDELYEKVKKAGEETFQEQILNRKELRRLQKLGNSESGKLARNSKIFFKLCSMEIENEELDYPIYQSQNEDTKNLRNDMEDLELPGDEEDEESRKSRREKLEEELTNIEKRKSNFIERNKELASCAIKGNLAITDEEKKRIEEILEDNSSETDDSSSTATSTPYTIDEKADELLKNLTEQLENINSETYRKFEKEKQTREEFLSQKEQLVLNSLRNLADSGSEIIHPISEDEMKKLINDYYAERESSCRNCSVKEFSDNDSKTEILEGNESASTLSIVTENRKITQEVINELVKEAKTTMPFFKFKNRTESIEEFEDK